MQRDAKRLKLHPPADLNRWRKKGDYGHTLHLLCVALGMNFSHTTNAKDQLEFATKLYHLLAFNRKSFSLLSMLSRSCWVMYTALRPLLQHLIPFRYHRDVTDYHQRSIAYARSRLMRTCICCLAHFPNEYSQSPPHDPHAQYYKYQTLENTNYCDECAHKEQVLMLNLGYIAPRDNGWILLPGFSPSGFTKERLLQNRNYLKGSTAVSLPHLSRWQLEGAVKSMLQDITVLKRELGKRQFK